MKNKHYNIFFTSEKDGLGKSFRISRLSLFFAMSLFSSIIIFACIGFNGVVNNDSIIYEVNKLRDYKYVTSNLLIESGMREESLSPEELDKLIIDYIIANNILYPELAPVNGYVTQGVSRGDENIAHAGINIASKIKDDVKSPLDGVVIVAEDNSESGGTIILHHKNNFFTIYKNLDTLFVDKRDLVLKDEVIAKVGIAEDNGPHLYFEIWKDNQVIDPRDLITDYREKDVSVR